MGRWSEKREVEEGGQLSCVRLAGANATKWWCEAVRYLWLPVLLCVIQV